MLDQSSVLAKVQKMDQKTKQYWLETLAYQSILSRELVKRAQQRGDRQAIKGLRQRVTKDARSVGVDLSSLKL
jgi:hypothetical protein